MNGWHGDINGIRGVIVDAQLTYDLCAPIKWGCIYSLFDANKFCGCHFNPSQRFSVLSCIFIYGTSR